jgi:four helix bundle protein
MALVKRFEDLRAGQAARRLVKEIYALTRREAFAHDYGLRDQIQRADVSAMCNIAEGFESGTNGDFSRFLTYARASAAEVQSSS